MLNVVIPSSVLPKARNISYHTIETFHDKRYGFVDLPEADAEKLKKRLNGAVLRGSKMRIEKARPEAIPEPSGETDPTKEKKKAKKAKDKSKKRKREIDVIPGVELEDRKVKRGWTTTEQDMIKEKREKSKKDRMDKRSSDDKKDGKDRKDRKDKKDEKKRKIKSKYTDGPECLFKTKLTESKPAKDSDDAAEHKKKKRKGDREVVIHEFEKTVKYPSFLKSSTAKANPEAVSFEDGVGWVDANGNVVESVSTRKKPRPTTRAKAAGPSVSKPTTAAAEDEDDETSSSGTSSSDEESGSSDQESESSSAAEEEVAEEENAAGEVKAEEKPKSKTEAQTLSSPTAALKLEVGRKRSSGSFSSLTITIPPTTPAKVHPLEALYKRPKAHASADQAAPKEPEPFSFFDHADDEEGEEEDEGDAVAPPSQPPMTPYTKQDFDYRNVRSAAPTPDTAHPSRSFNLWSRADTLEGALDEEDEDEDEGEGNEGEEARGSEEDEDTNMEGSAEQGAAATSNSADVPASEFQKQFWESRGDLNRSWRKRRKMAAKEKRYRENKARAQRAI